MNPVLKGLFDEIERQRADTLELVRTLPIQNLAKRPVQDKWSAGEIVSHLITAERLSLLYMRKKIQGVETLKNTGVWEEAKMTLLRVSQRFPGLKFRAPKVVVENTETHTDYISLEKAWTNVRDDLKDFLETIDDRHIERKMYKHAIVGYLNVQHALKFFREHVIHHTPQIRKIVHDTV